jgi:hypothetical protein
MADISEINGASPLYSYLRTELSGISGTYDVENGVYPGWCIDYHTPLPFDDLVDPDVMPIPVMLYSSYCPPGDLMDDGWDEVNYILNHKHPDAGWNDIHRAINQFVNFGDPISPPDPSSIAGQMVAAAQSNPGWMPNCGDVVAVIVDPLEDQISIEPFDDHERWQYTIIEVPVPCEYEGLTPGFWKNRGIRIGAWAEAGYETSNTLGTFFDIPAAGINDNPRRPVNPGDSLLDALRYKGGKGDSGMAQNLLRAAVAALLNAGHPDVNYPLSTQQVKDLVNDALDDPLDREEMEDAKDILDANNNLGADEWW